MSGDGRIAWLRNTLRTRRGVALARELWTRVICGDNAETCQDCGRRYILWHASNALYEAIVGHRRGLFCPNCFTQKARDAGIRIFWEPRRIEEASQSS